MPPPLPAIGNFASAAKLPRFTWSLLAKSFSLAAFIWTPAAPVFTSLMVVWMTGGAFWLLRRFCARSPEKIAALINEVSPEKILNTIPAWTIVSDPLGHLLYVDSRICEYTGLSREDLDGEGWLTTVHPEDREELQKQWVRAIIGRTPLEVEYRWRDANGSFRRFRVEGAPVCTIGRPEGLWYGVMRDIEEQYVNQERQNQARSVMTASTRLSTVSEMAATIAHEINQPLMAVMTNSAAGKAWLTGKAPSQEQAIEAFDRISRDAGSAAQVVARIRSLFKRSPLEKIAVDCEQTILEAVRGVEADLRRQGVKLKVDIPAQIPPILADPIQIRQVLHNLFQNAIEAMDAVNGDRRLLEINVIAHPDSSMAEIAVLDMGVGAVDLEEIFEAFVSTKTSGLGIGLAISRTIMESHNGTLLAERRHPYGLRFTMKLPLAIFP